jgi:hypothetical protein
MVICSGEIHFHWSSLQQTQHQVINFGFIQNTKYYTHEFHIYFLVVDIYIYICQCFFHHCWRFMNLAKTNENEFPRNISPCNRSLKTTYTNKVLLIYSCSPFFFLFCLLNLFSCLHNYLRSPGYFEAYIHIIQ